MRQVREALMTQTPDDGAELWPALRNRLAAQPGEGFAALAALAAPWRRIEGRYRRVQPLPEAISGAPNFILDGRHADWFGARLPRLEDRGWLSPVIVFAWRAALAGDLMTLSRRAPMLDEIAQAEGEDGFAPLSALLSETAGFLDWLAYDLAQRQRLSPPRIAPFTAPVFLRGDMAQVRVAGGAEFTERGIPR